jgi:hypothetical protein
MASGLEISVIVFSTLKETAEYLSIHYATASEVMKDEEQKT